MLLGHVAKSEARTGRATIHPFFMSIAAAFKAGGSRVGIALVFIAGGSEAARSVAAARGVPAEIGPVRQLYCTSIQEKSTNCHNG